MGLGSFLSKLGRGVEDYRYSRDFGSNYKQDFQAAQDYLNQMAAEREADKELKRRQVEEDRAWRLQDRTSREEEAKFRRYGTGLELLVGTAAKDDKGQWKLRTTEIGRQLKLTPEEAADLELAARGRLEAKDQATAAERAEDDRKRGLRLQDDLSLLGAREAADKRSEARRREAALAEKLVEGGLAPLLALGKPKTGGGPTGASTWMEQAAMLAPKGSTWQEQVDLARELEARWRMGPQPTPLGGAHPGATIPPPAPPTVPGAGGPRILVRRSNIGNVQHSVDGGVTWRPGEPPA